MWFRKLQTRSLLSAGHSQYRSLALTSILYLILFVFGFGSLFSQQVRLNIYRARVSDVALTSNYLTTTVDPKVISSGSQYGSGLELVFKKVGSLELLYLRQVNFQANNEKHPEARSPVLPAAINYLLLSAGGHLNNPLGEIQGFGALVGGISINPQRRSADQSGKAFAWGTRLGCTWWAAKKIGIKLESLFLFSQSPVYDAPVVNVRRFYIQTTIHQLTVSGGVMFKLCGE